MISFHLDHFENYTIAGQSTQDASYPSSNLKLWTRREVPWKTTVATDSWVVLNFGSAKVINSVVAIDVNYATAKIQGNATDSWGAPSFDSGNITLGLEGWTNRYRLIKDPNDFAAFNYQYLRWFIPTQTPTDGASVFRTGMLIVTTQAVNYPIDPNSMEVTPRKEDSQIELWSGAIETINHGERFCDFRYSIIDERITANHDSFNDLLVDTDRTKPIVLGFGSALHEKKTSTAYVFVCQRQEPLVIAYPNAGEVNYSSIELREYV